jgi:hypothetical protein
LLTGQLLDRLSATWRAHGVPVEEALAPGRELTAFTSDDGSRHVDLPAELRTWWSWHDGHVEGTEREWGIGPLFEQMSSAESRARWQRSMAMAQLVEWWMEAVELGLWTYDPDRDTWRKAPSDRAVDERYRGLM